jgi:hypothetical protein
MTAHLSFDTLAFAKRLAAAGMQSRQAQALAEALNDIVFDTLATKNDLRDLEVATKASLKDLEHRLTVRMGAMITGSMALTVAILGTLSILS